MNLLREKLRSLGQHRLCCSDAPDTSGINAAAQSNAQIGQEALDFYKQQYSDTAPDRAAASSLATQQANLQNQLSQQQLHTQSQQQARYETEFQPIEDKIVADAQNYDTPARREAAAVAASADVQTGADAQRQATMRTMERSGALPSSGRVMAMQGMQDIATAKAKAGAANTARQQVETLGAAKMSDAAALGRGVVSNSATAAQLGMQAGNSAVNNGQAPLNIAAAGAGIMGQGFGAATQGNSSAASLYGQAAGIQNQANASSNSVWGALGSVTGSTLGAGSGSIAAKLFGL